MSVDTGLLESLSDCAVIAEQIRAADGEARYRDRQLPTVLVVLMDNQHATIVERRGLIRLCRRGLNT